MRTFLYFIAALAVISLAFWAYHENYSTQAEIRKSRDLQRQVSDARQRLRVLNAEWAYLNRPERLRDLAELNFAKLGLLPLGSQQFGMVDQISYPSLEIDDQEIPITNPVDVMALGEGQ